MSNVIEFRPYSFFLKCFVAGWVTICVLLLFNFSIPLYERLQYCVVLSIAYFVAAVAMVIFWIPTLIMWHRGDRRIFLIGAINACLGATGVGWLILLGYVLSMPENPQKLS